MPYTISPDIFTNVMDKVFRGDELKEALVHAAVSPEWVRSQILSNRERILLGVTPYIDEYNTIELNLAMRTPPPASYMARLSRRILWIILIAIVLLTPIWVSASFIWESPISYRALVEKLSEPPYQISLVLALTWVTILFCHVLWENRKIRRLASSPGMQSLKNELHNKGDYIENKVIADLVRQEARLLIERHSSPSYELQLTVSEAPGLAEVYNPAYDISTTAVEKLRFMLRTMPGGSIGIAGPRGAGKSTLLRIFCQDSMTKLEGRKAFTVFTSAPVEYKARDFILYLFGAVCQRVIGVDRVPMASRSRHWQDYKPPTPLLIFGALPRMILPVLLLIGLTMCFTSLWLAHSSLLSKSATSGKPAASQNRVAPSTKPVTPEAPGTISLFQYAKELGLGPALLFRWGLGMVVLTVAVTFLSGAYARITFQSLRRNNYSPNSSIKEEAEEWLRAIRFQQSFSTGWSGALKLPVGAEANLSAATTLAQLQLTLPEIAGGLVQFLRRLTKDYFVLICIDEMDKLISDAKAHNFLNDLKAIFGVERAFYLISVSESAMSSFERRGLPFRDVFDSTFDSIIYIGYLDFKAARDLISRRVVGMPLQFVALCYTVAGGLPRDLLRACRSLMDIKRTAESSSLPELGELLIKDEVSSKWQAAFVATEKIPVQPARKAVLEHLYQLRLEGNASSWIEAAVCINQTAVEYENSAPNLKALCEELGAYLYFCATLRQFFVASLDQYTFDEAWKTGRIDQLAKARQAFSIDPAIAKSLIDGFRREEGMDVPSVQQVPGNREFLLKRD